MNWLFIFWILLFKHVVCEESRISDLRLCADPKCTEPVSEGKTLITYNSDDSRILSFRPNVPVLIYSKSAGKNPDLWGVKIEGKRGYVPRGLIRENRIIKSKKDLKYKVPTEIAAGDVIEVSQDSIAVTNNDSSAVDAALLPSDTVSEAFPSQTEPLSSKETAYSGFLIKGAYAEPQHAPDPNTVAKPYDVIDGTTFYGEEYSNLETSTVPSVTTQHDIKPTIAVGIPEVQQENSFPSDHMTKTLTEDAFLSKGPDVNLENIDVEQNILQSTTEKILEFFSGHSTEENVQKDEPSVELQPSPSEGEINVSTHENMENNTPVHDNSELTTGQNTESTNDDSNEFEGYSSRKLLEDQVLSDKIEEASSEDISISNDDIDTIVDAEEDPEDDDEEEEDEYEDEEDVSEEEETNDSGVNSAEQNIEMRSDGLSVNSKFTEPQEENSVPIIPSPHVQENIPVDDARPAVFDENKYVTLNEGESVSTSLPEISHDTNVKTETSDIQNVDTNNTANSNSEISQENFEQKYGDVEFSTVPDDQKVTIETQHNNIEQQFVTSGQQHSVASSGQTSIQQEGEQTTEHILQPAIDKFSEAIDPYANVAQPVEEKVLVQDNVYTDVSDHNEKLSSDKISDNTKEGSSEIDIPKEEATTENININSNSDIVVNVASKSDSDTVPISSENGEQEINIVKEAETSSEHTQEFSTEPNWVDSSDVIPPTNLDDISEENTYISEVSTVEPASSQPEENVHLNENVVDSSSETDSLSYDPIDSSQNLAPDNETPSEGFFTNIYYMIFGEPSTSDSSGDITISETVNEDLKTENDVLDSVGMSDESREIIKETVESSSVKKDDYTGSQTASTCRAASQLGSTEVDSQCSDLERDMNEASNKLHGETDGYFDFTSVLMDIQPPSVEMIVYVSITGVFVLLFTLGHYYLEKRSRDGTLISKLNALEKELMMSSKECVTLKDELKVTKEKLVNVEHVSLDSNTCVTDLQTELEECKASKLELEEQVAALEKELESATETGLELNKMVSELLSSQQGSESLIKSVQTLQEQLDSQQGTISTMNTSLAVKSLENEKLQSELSAANERLQQLEEEIIKLNEDLNNLSKEKLECEAAMDGNMKALEAKFSETLEEKAAEISLLNQDRDCLQMTLEEVKQALSIKDTEVSVLQDCLKQLRTMEEEEAEGGDKLQALLDVGRLRAELKMAAVKNQTLQEKLQGEEDARKLLEDHVKVISGEVERLRSNYEVAERDKVEAQTKLEVLSNYFKEKETQLQKELGLQEAMFSQKENDVMTTYERIKSLQDEIENYNGETLSSETSASTLDSLGSYGSGDKKGKLNGFTFQKSGSQNETLKKEILDQERSFKGLVASLEKKAHENWVTARQAERKLEESRQDAAQLRNRLIVVEKNFANSFVQNGETMKISDRLPSESNGDLSASPLHISMQDSAASPLHYREGLPVSPPLIGPGPPLPPGPFMGLPPFMPPLPPPGAPFMPPPPPIFPEDRRPPPVGRMSSPPPNRRYSPPSPSYDGSPPLSPPYRHSPHLENDSRYRHMSPPPHWENSVNPRSGFRPVPLPPLRRGSPRDNRGSALSSGHSSESLEKSGRNSGKV